MLDDCAFCNGRGYEVGIDGEGKRCVCRGNARVTLDLFAAAPVDSEMKRLARAYAARLQWSFRGIEHRPDLLGALSARAIFTDRAGTLHERTVDDLRSGG